MTTIVSALSIHEHFLTAREKTLRATLDGRLQTLVNDRLLASGHTPNIDLARLILHVISENRAQEEMITSFFLRVLSGTDKELCLDCLHALKQEGVLLDFFHYASLKSWNSTQEAYEAYRAFVETEKKDMGADPILSSTLGSHKSSEEERAAIIQFSGLSSRLVALVMRYLSELPKDRRLSLDIYQKVLTQLQSEASLSELEKINVIKMLVVVTSDTNVQGYFEVSVEELFENMLLVNKSFGDEFFIAFCTVNYTGSDSRVEIFRSRRDDGRSGRRPFDPSRCAIDNRQRRGQIDQAGMPATKKTTLESRAVYRHRISLDEVIRILNLIKRIGNASELLCLVEGFITKVLSEEYVLARNDLILGLEEKVPNILSEEIASQGEITLLISRFATAAFPLSPGELDKITAQYGMIQEYCEKNSSLRMSELVTQSLVIGKKKEIKEEDILELIAIARLSLWIKFNIYLHNTQILTVLGQLIYPKGCIAEVKTGEGKSMIVCVMAFIMAMQKKSVHVISSSSSLASRDQKKYENFFKTFGFVTSAISDSPLADKFHADILYGTASDFEFGVMREMLYHTPLYLQTDPIDSEKRFDCVIVDEVDNLTIDTGLNSARLGYPAEKTYDWIYAPIFKFIKTGGSIGSAAELKIFLSNEMGGRFRDWVVDLKDEDLLVWLSSAHHALFELDENVHYVIRDGRVEIVDASNTGRIMTSSRWSKGVHEFVEIKHDLQMQQESITPISLSHSVYYSMYQSVYGLTGTLGSVFEREEMLEIYNVNSFDVPTYHAPKKEDRFPRVFKTDREHMDAILDEVRCCISDGRPILVLCETIKESEAIRGELNSLSIPHEILNEVQEKSEDAILDKAGFPCAVTVATNTAGRGTDILLRGDSRKNGGLHVLLTNFPASQRVEEQARGRTGRQGDPGSSAMLVLAPDIEGDEKKILEILEQKRKASLQLMKDIHIHHARIERFKFELIKSFFKRLAEFHERLPQLTAQLARDQASRRLLVQTQPSFESLPKQDALIALEIHSLLCSTELPSAIETSWKSCIQKVVKRIQSRILNDWSVNFHAKAEELVERSEIAKYSKLQELFKEVSPVLAEAHEGAFSESVRAILSRVDREFKSKLEAWGPYLVPTGSGILEYMEVIRKGTWVPIGDF
ncbi:MAG: hypothetical protein K9M07_04415 [Simkaniaceae bacterium]|nr:hypothetical protein [Simkaniaceae bacterium]